LIEQISHPNRDTIEYAYTCLQSITTNQTNTTTDKLVCSLKQLIKRWKVQTVPTTVMTTTETTTQNTYTSFACLTAAHRTAKMNTAEVSFATAHLKIQQM
jgi:hypothetical protein